MRPFLMAMLMITPLGGAAASMPGRCLAERDGVAAEATTPGILLHLARETLAACLARAAAGAGGG
jgi:hypothetical protein